MPDFSSLKNFLEKYFPGEISPEQLSQFQVAFTEICEWNEKINLISRKDMENLAEKHFLHSLAIAKAVKFTPGTHILDVGTGGGFPGTPLAIFFPKCEFMLIDSIQKKMKVVEDVVKKCGLKNVQTACIRAENLTMKYDFVVSRAVAPLVEFIPWLRKRFLCRKGGPLGGGILYLKGDTWEEEMKTAGKSLKTATAWPLNGFFDEEFFKTKFLIHIPMCN